MFLLKKLIRLASIDDDDDDKRIQSIDLKKHMHMAWAKI